MKILSIGNECSSDIQTYLPFLAKAAGKELLLGNLRLDNANIENHYRNYIDEEEVYVYETYLPGETDAMKPDGIALHEAVEDDDWDIITLQQEHSLAGDIESFRPYLSELTAYCKLMHPETKTALNQMWAYESGCGIPDFRNNFNNNQQEMYESLAGVCNEIAEEAEIDLQIPLAKAFQIARSTNLGDRFTTDGKHLNELGQFLASCVLYEAVFGESALYSPFDLPEYDKAISDLIKICADTAF